MPVEIIPLTIGVVFLLLWVYIGRIVLSDRIRGGRRGRQGDSYGGARKLRVFRAEESAQLDGPHHRKIKKAMPRARPKANA